MISKNNVADKNATAWRLESSLREFPNIIPINFWFEYPIHRVDATGELQDAPAQGTPGAGQAKNSKSKSAKDAENEFRRAYQILSLNGDVSVSDMMNYLNVCDKTVYARVKKMGNEFTIKKGVIYCDTAPATGSNSNE